MTMHTTMANSGELFWFKGTLVNVRLSWNAGEDRVSVVEHYMPYGESPPLHIHRNEDEVFHILEGSMRIQIDGKESVAQRGRDRAGAEGRAAFLPRRIPRWRALPDDHLRRRLREHDPRDGRAGAQRRAAAAGRADAGDDRGADRGLRAQRHRHHRGSAILSRAMGGKGEGWARRDERLAHLLSCRLFRGFFDRAARQSALI